MKRCQSKKFIRADTREKKSVPAKWLQECFTVRVISKRPLFTQPGHTSAAIAATDFFFFLKHRRFNKEGKIIKTRQSVVSL